MSITLMSAVWELDLSSTDKLVMLALADRANDDGQCWPGIASLTKKCSLSTRALQTALARLEAAGYVTRHLNAGKNRTNTYTLNPAANAPRSKCTPQQTTPDPAANAPNTSRTIIESNKTSSYHSNPRAVRDVDLPDCISREAWDGFVDMRRRKKAVLTDRAKKLILDKLAKLSPDGSDRNAILDQSTAHGWTGVFELKGNNNGRNGQPAKPQRDSGPTNPMVLAFARMAGHAVTDDAPPPCAHGSNATGNARTAGGDTWRTSAAVPSLEHH